MDINISNFSACIARIAARGSIGQEEARALLEETAEGGERQRRSGVEDPIVTAAWSLARDMKQRAANNRIDAIRNATVRQARITEATTGGIAGSVNQILSRMDWTAGTNPVENVTTLGRARHNSWISVADAELHKAGLLKAAADPANFRDIAIAIAQKRGLMIDYPTAAKPFQDIADIIRPLLESIRVTQNSEGARIADAHDWIASTSHDRDLMRRGGRGMEPTADFDEAFSRWRSVIEPRFKPIDPIVPREGESDADATTRFWQSIFNAKLTGVHMGTGESLTPGGALPAAAAGRYEIAGGNMARRLSEGRVIQPNSASAWAEYMQLYGSHTNWYSLIDHAAERGGRQSALMHFFGTNPANNLSLIIRRIEEQFRDSDPDGVVRFQSQVKGTPFVRPGLDNLMQRLDGRANNPENDLWHRIGSTARAFYDMVYLGFVAGTHAGSLVATFPSEARIHGIGTLGALGKMVKGMIPEGLSDVERRSRLASLGAYGDGVSRYTADPFAHGRNVPGYVAAMHNRFMRATGLPYLFGHAKAGMREMLSNNLAQQAGKEFTNLHPSLQTVLKRYGIDKPEWDMLRANGPDLRAPNGLEYLTPHAALATPGGRDLAEKLAMYYQDAADHATVTAGPREQAMLRGSMKPGSWQDEMLSSLMQFKTWPIAAMHQVIGREIYNNLTWGRAASGIGAVVALSMLGGYLRMTARDLAYGQPPRTPQNPGDAAKIALAALAQGGGLGIFGDFLFGEANRMGGSKAQTLGGPVTSDVGALADIYTRWLQSIGTTQKGDVWPELARWAIGHIPFQNLFYLKGAADYLFYYHVFEGLHPGWWERMNRRMQKEQGRTMTGYTPGAGVPWGIPHVYLGGAGPPSGILAHTQQ